MCTTSVIRVRIQSFLNYLAVPIQREYQNPYIIPLNTTGLDHYYKPVKTEESILNSIYLSTISHYVRKPIHILI